jgi:hypothetical protein
MRHRRRGRRGLLRRGEASAAFSGEARPAPFSGEMRAAVVSSSSSECGRASSGEATMWPSLAR